MALTSSVERGDDEELGPLDDMMNCELDEFVQCELAQISACAPTVQAALPAQLYHFTDAAGIEAFVRHGNLRALDWRLGWDGPLVQYGIDLVNTFFGMRAQPGKEPLRAQFCRDVAAHFNPHGTHFDGFITRLFDTSKTDVAGPASDYALGLSTAALPVRTAHNTAHARILLLSAIYPRDEQLSVVQALYQRYEDYFVSAVERFGDRYRDDLLFTCRDRFRHDIGTFLMRFRDPVSRYQGEWIAIALALPDDNDERIEFNVVNNRLLPVVSIDVIKRVDTKRQLPLSSIAVSASLPFASTQEALLAYMGSCNVHGVAVVLADDETRRSASTQ